MKRIKIYPVSLEGVLKLPISGERSQIKTVDMGNHFHQVPRLSEIDGLCLSS